MNDVTVTSSTEVANVEDLSQWGLEEQVIDSKDVILPRVWLMQALSKLVAEDEVASAGDIVNSVSEEIIAPSGEWLKVVPVKFEKLWFVMSKTEDKPDLLAIEPVTPLNASREREGTYEGQPCSFNYALRFYLLLEGEDLPAVVTFKSTSLRAGKQLLTEAYVKNIKAGKNPASRYLALSSQKQKNDKGVYYVFAVKAMEETPIDVQREALQWVNTLKKEVPKIAGDEAEPTAQAETESY
jgi:hypothetical protein